jgi:hypothetical protein
MHVEELQRCQLCVGGMWKLMLVVRESPSGLVGLCGT